MFKRLANHFNALFFNTLEYGVTRFLDGATSMLLIWSMPTERYSVIAVGQAVVTLWLVFFVSPSNALIKNYSFWKKYSESLWLKRLQIFRRYGWAMIGLSIFIAAVLARFHHFGEGYSDRFYSMARAFFLFYFALSCGVDREYLRMELDLKVLNLFTVYQKLFAFLGCLFVLRTDPSRIDLLALVAVLSIVSTALFVQLYVNKKIKKSLIIENVQNKSVDCPLSVKVSILQHAIWPHLSAYIWIWIQSLDLLYLEWFGYSSKTTGLYGAGLKISNLSMAIPFALSTYITILLGRKKTVEKKSDLKTLLFSMKWGAIASVVQFCVLYLLLPQIIEIFSRGRWSLEERNDLRNWIIWILASGVLMNLTFLMSNWLLVRAQVKLVFYKAYLPWAVFSLVVYGASGQYFGPIGLAVSNFAVVLFYFVLLSLQVKKAHDAA